MSDERFFKHPSMPFAECRHSKNSSRQYKPHIHRTFSIGAINQGEVIYEVDGKVVKLQPGNLALINPETLHTCNPAESSERNYYILHLNVDWCLQLQQSIWDLESFCPVIMTIMEDYALYDDFIKAMDALMGEAELLEKEQILVEVVERIFLRACEPAASKSKPSVQIEQLKQQLSMNLDQDLSLGELAQNSHTNPYTLLRQFKAATGITPHAYRLNCRIDLARNLLQKGYDLTQVALECGFFDQSHFHRHFKAITTVTPKEYQINFIQ